MERNLTFCQPLSTCPASLSCCHVQGERSLMSSSILLATPSAGEQDSPSPSRSFWPD